MAQEAKRISQADAEAEIVALEGTLKVHPKFLYKYYLSDFGGGQTCALFGAEALQKIPVGSWVRVEGRLGTRFHSGGDAQNLSPFPRTWYIYMDVAAVKVLREPEKATEKSPEEIIQAGIHQFRERMRSDDPKVREAEFDNVMPDKKTIELLFGDDAKLIWPRLSEGLQKMRAGSQQAKAEFDRQGTLTSLKLVDIRKEDPAGLYRRMLQMIPEEIPVFRAIATYENGSGGSGCYIVIDGRMRFVRGLESIAEFIDEQKKSKE